MGLGVFVHQLTRVMIACDGSASDRALSVYRLRLRSLFGSVEWVGAHGQLEIDGKVAEARRRKIVLFGVTISIPRARTGR